MITSLNVWWIEFEKKFVPLLSYMQNSIHKDPRAPKGEMGDILGISV
jgi:hypothetical protein